MTMLDGRSIVFTDMLTYNSNRGWLIRWLATNQHDDCAMTDRTG